MSAIPQWLSLTVVSIVAGIGLLWLFSKTSNQAAIRKTKKKLQAHLLEMRLYADNPGVVWRAQRSLFASNLRYFALMLKPAFIATLPMVFVLVVLDGFYGKKPLGIGEQAVLTVQMAEGAKLDAPPPKLEVPAGIKVETDAVRVSGDRQVSWRLRAVEPVDGELQLAAAGGVVTKSIQAGGSGFVSSRRVGSLVSLPLYPGEAPLGEKTIEWVEVAYPPANVRMFGFETHWLVWFLIISMAAAFLLKSRFKVTV